MVPREGRGVADGAVDGIGIVTGSLEAGTMDHTETGEPDHGFPVCTDDFVAEATSRRPVATQKRTAM